MPDCSTAPQRQAPKALKALIQDAEVRVRSLTRKGPSYLSDL